MQIERVVVSGGWSYGNIGDEAIADASIFLVNKYFSSREIIYTSYKNEDFKIRHSVNKVVDSIHKLVVDRLDYYKELYTSGNLLTDLSLKNYSNMFDENTLFIMSGGGYFQEEWESQVWARLIEIKIAKLKKSKIALIGQSIGPFYSKNVIQNIKWSFEQCDYIAVRDEYTKDYLNDIVPLSKIELVPDLAIIISDIYEKEHNIDSRIINIMPANYITYSSLNKKKSSSKIIGKIKNRLSINRWKYYSFYKKIIDYYIYEKNLKVNFVMSTDWKWDRKFVSRLSRGLDKEKYEIFEGLDSSDLCKILSEGLLTISTKMHPIIITSSYCVPSIAVSYNFKLDGFMKLIHREKYCINIDHIKKKDFIFAQSVLENELIDQNEITLCKKEIYKMMERIAKL